MAYLDGLESKQIWDKREFFDAYVTSAKEGEYSLAQTEYDPYQAAMVKKYYFYGGVALAVTQALRNKNSLTSEEQTKISEDKTSNRQCVVSVPDPKSKAPWRSEEIRLIEFPEDIEDIILAGHPDLNGERLFKRAKLVAESIKEKKLPLTEENVLAELRRTDKWLRAAFADIPEDRSGRDTTNVRKEKGELAKQPVSGEILMVVQEKTERMRGIHHDMMNILQTTMGDAEFIKRKTTDKNIIVLCDQLLGLILQLKDLSWAIRDNKVIQNKMCLLLQELLKN